MAGMAPMAGISATALMAAPLTGSPESSSNTRVRSRSTRSLLNKVNTRMPIITRLLAAAVMNSATSASAT